jgi:hypothetical protein
MAMKFITAYSEPVVISFVMLSLATFTNVGENMKMGYEPAVMKFV